MKVYIIQCLNKQNKQEIFFRSTEKLTTSHMFGATFFDTFKEAQEVIKDNSLEEWLPELANWKAKDCTINIKELEII